MTTEEQNLVENLFDRLRQTDVNPKDPEAEQLIRTKTAALAHGVPGQGASGAEASSHGANNQAQTQGVSQPKSALV